MKDTVSMTVIYGVIALAAFLLMIGYWRLIREKEKWLQYLYIAVFGINAGYFFLSISHTLQAALTANRIVDLCSAFLPFFMLMLIMKECGIQCSKRIFAALLLAGSLLFLLAASGGFLTLYYKAVRIEFVHGAAVLVKDGGPLYFLNGLYLLLYLAGMLGIILYTMKKRKGISYKLAVFLLAAVLSNIATWLLEQLIPMEFEFLALSYIFTELLLLLLYMILEEPKAAAVSELLVDGREEGISKEVVSENYDENLPEDKKEDAPEQEEASNKTVMDQVQIRTAGTALIGIEKLSVREMEVLLLIMDNKKRKDIAKELEITENTVKKHTSHIFSKLGISSRKELFEKCSHVSEAD